MSNQRFTPGPWDFPLYPMDEAQRLEAESLGISVARFTHNDGAVSVMAGSDDDRKPVAHALCQTGFKRGEGYKTICDERDANARLMAAAPDLFDALRSLLSLCEAGGVPFDEPGRPTVNAARAALSRASQVQP